MSGSLRRRDVLLAGAAFASVSLSGRSDARVYGDGAPWTPGIAPGLADVPQTIPEGDFKFFTTAEAAFIDAAVARLIPADHLGAGAKEAGVTVFLDRQLAGPYGRAERWYMQGPWHDGTKSQGYQSRLSPAELYRAAIRFIDQHCRQQLGGKGFAELSTDQQDSVLKEIEKGKLKIADIGPHAVEIEGAKGPDGDTFFAVLMQNTIEGFFSDPIYGGNRDMVGWKLIGFPGARYDYRPYVERHGEKLDLPPVGVRGRPEWKDQS
jgi:gluconate 2-dehydrogenase gamma chain